MLIILHHHEVVAINIIITPMSTRAIHNESSMCLIAPRHPAGQSNDLGPLGANYDVLDTWYAACLINDANFEQAMRVCRARKKRMGWTIRHQ